MVIKACCTVLMETVIHKQVNKSTYLTVWLCNLLVKEILRLAFEKY